MTTSPRPPAPLLLEGPWTLLDEVSGARHPAQVPGTVHTDLLAAGLIPDPYHRDNSLRLDWISRQPWTYEKTFVLPAAFRADDPALHLRCDGLDTLAELALNGIPLGSAANAYRRHEFPVAPALRPGENHLAVRFLPVPEHLERAQAARPLRNWGTRFFQGIGHLRKPGYHFGWDWAPPLLPCGIWKTITLVSLDHPRLAEVFVRQHHAPDHSAVTLQISARAAGLVPAGSVVVHSLALDGAPVATATSALSAAPDTDATSVLQVPEPRLWWPLGLGDQPLYTLRTELRAPDGAVLARDEKRLGLRTLRLRQEPAPDGTGASFEFVANGVPFFARGANWVPADCFLPRLDSATYRRVVATAAEENMNMLRVWGGGIYESADFMDACDEFGICVWHDFMFSCATYPVHDPAFLAEVRLEAEEAVRRLRHHASLALWCGNNELEEGLVGPDPARQMLPADYDALFVDLLGGVVRDLQPDCDYIRSSGHSPGPRRDPWHTWDLDSGDSHIWWRIHGLVPAADRILADLPRGTSTPADAHRIFENIFPVLRPPSWPERLVVPRFCSEWGKQSFPDLATIRAFSAPADLSVTGRVMEHHQQGSNAEIIGQLAHEFPLPGDFAGQVTASQLFQGELFRLMVELWRQDTRCRGALFWTLNDCWPSVEWSQVDWHGRRKASCYLFRRFNAPVLLSFREKTDATTAEIFLHNDTRAPFAGTLEIVCTDFHGQPLAVHAASISAAAGEVRAIGSLDLAPALALRRRTECFVSARLVPAAPGLAPLRAHLVLAKPKELELPSTAFAAELLACEPARARLALTASAAAFWVEVSLAGRDNARDLRYSDNFFHLRAGERIEIEITDATASLHPDDLRSALRLRTLNDLAASSPAQPPAKA